MTLLIGVDVGGTKTEAAAAHPGGDELCRAQGPGAALQPGRVLRSAATIADVVRRVMALAGQPRADLVLVGAAGAGRREEHEELARALRAEEMAETVRVTTDGEIALVAAFGDGPGILVAAGTGSVALLRTPDGGIQSAGGQGWQMGDAGSGYALGRAALAAVAREADGVAQATALTAAVLTATRCADLSRLIRWAAAAGPGEVATLAPVVFDTAAEGDTVAARIVAEAAGDLADLAGALQARVPETPLSLAVSGGLLRPGSPLLAALADRLASASGPTFDDTPVDPVRGALRLAETTYQRLDTA